MNEKVMEFTIEEVSTMIALISRLDPLRYENDRTKALIYKCRAGQNSYDLLRVVP